MNILFDINHPGHVHLFKNAIRILKDRGHHVVVFSRNKDITIQLLDNYKIDHIVLSKAQKGVLKLAVESFIRQWNAAPLLRKHKIQLCLSVTGASIVHVCKLFHIPTVVFYDTEYAKLQISMTLPFVKNFLTPDSFSDDLGPKHIKYKSTHELAYLYPKYFTPDPGIYELLGLTRGEKFTLIRCVSWSSAHDVGITEALSLELKRELIRLCSHYTQIFIVSEVLLEDEFETYRLSIPPERIHDVLYYATLCVSEGGTTATEAAVLGTPAIQFSQRGKYCGIFDDLRDNYDLLYHIDNGHDLLKKIQHLLSDPNLKQLWQEKRETLLQDKMCLTDYMIEYLERNFSGI